MDVEFIFVVCTLPDGETIFRIMQYIKSQFARRFNARHGRTGPFWNERFKDEIIDFLPKPEQSFFFLIKLIRNKGNRYSCWCSSAMLESLGEKRNMRKEVMAEITISHHKFFKAPGSSPEEQARKLNYIVPVS